MRRHYTNYFKGVHSFKEFRQKLVTQEKSLDLFETFENIKAVYANYEFA
jgi:hypothetical protein